MMMTLKIMTMIHRRNIYFPRTINLGHQIALIDHLQVLLNNNNNRLQRYRDSSSQGCKSSKVPVKNKTDVS